MIDAEKDNKSRVKRTHLSFEDFLEAPVRLSELLALPTDAELAAAHAEDAGQEAGRRRASLGSPCERARAVAVSGSRAADRPI